MSWLMVHELHSLQWPLLHHATDTSIDTSVDTPIASRYATETFIYDIHARLSVLCC